MITPAASNILCVRCLSSSIAVSTASFTTPVLLSMNFCSSSDVLGRSLLGQFFSLSEISTNCPSVRSTAMLILLCNSCALCYTLVNQKARLLVCFLRTLVKKGLLQISSYHLAGSPDSNGSTNIAKGVSHPGGVPKKLKLVRAPSEDRSIKKTFFILLMRINTEAWRKYQLKLLQKRGVVRPQSNSSGHNSVANSEKIKTKHNKKRKRSKN